MTKGLCDLVTKAFVFFTESHCKRFRKNKSYITLTMP